MLIFLSSSYPPSAFLLQVYTNLEDNRSHVVNTGWAMLALIDAGQVSIHLVLHGHLFHIDIVLGSLWFNGCSRFIVWNHSTSLTSLTQCENHWFPTTWNSLWEFNDSDFYLSAHNHILISLISCVWNCFVVPGWESPNTAAPRS